MNMNCTIFYCYVFTCWNKLVKQKTSLFLSFDTHYNERVNEYTAEYQMLQSNQKESTFLIAAVKY